MRSHGIGSALRWLVVLFRSVRPVIGTPRFGPICSCARLKACEPARTRDVTKSRRRTAIPKRKNRINLFSQVPNWKLSTLGSNKALLDAHGYEVSGRRQLYCTISGKMPNPNGFVLSVDGDKDWLRQNHVEAEKVTRMVIWEMSKLRERLTSKHRQTFWVSAETEVVPEVRTWPGGTGCVG
ncbi:MAG: MvaI/BcnI family restriction endonuclease [Paracoccaceae bacterium]